MPIETPQAITWTFSQVDYDGNLITKESPSYMIVDKVREYFNSNGIVYSTFNYDDLIPFLN